MEHAAERRWLLAGIGATLTAAIEVPERQRVGERLADRGGASEIARPLAGVAPEARGADPEREDDERECDAERPRHRRVGYERVERAFGVWMPGEKCCAAGSVSGRGQRDREHRRGREAQHEAVAREEPCERVRPRVLPVGSAADIGEHPREVEGELVRWRVLARRIARAAVVTEVGEVREVALGEVEPALERGKHRAIALAVAARVADRRHPCALRDELRCDRVMRRHGVRPLRPRCVRRWCR